MKKVKVKFVYWLLPAFVSYKEVDRGVKNFARKCFVTLEPKYKCDEGILQHELTHVKQWYRGLGIFFESRYRSREGRLQYEAEAYINQTKYKRCDGTYLTLEEAAEKMTWSKYDLGMTKDEILEYLRRTYEKRTKN